MSATTSRRAALKAGAGFFGAAVVGASASPNDEHPDSLLLAACAEFNRHERRLKAAPLDDEDAFDRIADDVAEAQQPHIERMCGLHAVTLKGLKARAAALMLWEPALARVDHHSDTQGSLIAALIRDVAALQT